MQDDPLTAIDYLSFPARDGRKQYIAYRPGVPHSYALAARLQRHKITLAADLLGGERDDSGTLYAVGSRSGVRVPFAGGDKTYVRDSIVALIRYEVRLKHNTLNEMKDEDNG